MKLGDNQEVDAVCTYIAILELQSPSKQGFSLQNLRLIPCCAFVLLRRDVYEYSRKIEPSTSNLWAKCTYFKGNYKYCALTNGYAQSHGQGDFYLTQEKMHPWPMFSPKL